MVEDGRVSLLATRSISMSSLFCLQCKSKALKGPTCKICGRIFHPSCAERLDLAVDGQDNVICCGNASRIATSSDSAIVHFLESVEFSNIVSSITNKTISPLIKEIQMLKKQVTSLQKSNDELISCVKNLSTTKCAEHLDVNRSTKKSQNINIIRNKVTDVNKTENTSEVNILQTMRLHQLHTVKLIMIRTPYRC